MKKNKLKKSIALILSLGMALSLCTACSTDNDDLNETKATAADNKSETQTHKMLGGNDLMSTIEVKVISVKDDKTALVEVIDGNEKAEKGNDSFKEKDKFYLKTTEVALQRCSFNDTGFGGTVEYPHKVKPGEIISFLIPSEEEYEKKDGANYYNDVKGAKVKVTDIKEYPEDDVWTDTFEDEGKVISIAQNGDLLMKFENNGCGFFKENEDTAIVHYDRAIVYEYSSVKGKGKITDSEYTPKVGDTLQVYAEPKNTFSESDRAFDYRDGKPYVKATGSIVKYVEK